MTPMAEDEIKQIIEQTIKETLVRICREEGTLCAFWSMEERYVLKDVVKFARIVKTGAIVALAVGALGLLGFVLVYGR